MRLRMDKVLFSRRPRDCVPAVEQTLGDAINFSREFGFRDVLYSYSYHEMPVYYLKLLASWRSADVLMAIYPWLCRNSFSALNPIRDVESIFFEHLLRLKHRIGTILFVYDLPIEQAIFSGRGKFYGTKSFELESKVLNCFDILCVFNLAMRKHIRDRYNIDDGRFVEFECPDYCMRPNVAPRLHSGQGKWNIFYASGWTKGYTGEWMKRLKKVNGLTWNFLGADWDWLSRENRQDFFWRLLNTNQKVCDYLASYADFGIITYSEGVNVYSNYGCGSKFGAYLTAGVPILVNENCKYVASLVRKYGLGLSFDSVERIPDLLMHLPDSDYVKFTRNCEQFAEKMRNGYFFKRALAEALRRLRLN